MSMLSNVFDRGGDATKNIFEVSFHTLPGGVGGSGAGYTGLIDTDISYRTKTFTVPSMGVMTYDVDFKTVKLKFPGGKVEFDPKVDTELRIDRYWQVYKDLVIWRNKLANPGTGEIGMDKYDAILSTNTRCEKIQIATMPISGVVDKHLHRWEFTKAFPMTVGDVAFDYAAGENISMTISFGFVEMIDWARSGTDDVNLAEVGAGGTGALKGLPVPPPTL